MRLVTTAMVAVVVVFLSPRTLLAQSPESSQQPASTSVPRLINISGTFRPADGQKPGRVEVVTLAVYGEETGGEPLWQETQSVSVDPLGNYSLLLGATQADGVPLDVFTSGQARWLGMVWERPGEVEAARTRLTSVPYALRASDAATLGGKPASAYLLAPSAGGQTTAGTIQQGVTTQAVLPGTANFIAKYVTAEDVGTSVIYESGGFVGIHTTTPLDILHARFADSTGGLTGLAVQNLNSSATSYSGMLFYDHTGALGQFQGFNNGTKEYRINNVAAGGTINFMTGGVSRFKVANNGKVGIGVTDPLWKLHVADPTAGTIVVSATNSSSGVNTHGIGVAGNSINNPGFGVGGSFVGGFHGVEGAASGGNFVGSAIGVRGDVFGTAGTRYAVFADGSVSAGTATAVGIYATATGAAINWAGYFQGSVHVNGTLSKSAGAFKIDHPLDPENKYLSHAFVESPDMKNIYDGVAVLGASGEATITLPDWFEALNENFRYQLTPMGAAFVPYVAEEIAGNQFTIAGGVPGKKVSWQVTGIRKDRYAQDNRIRIEEDKVPAERGTCLYPPLCGGMPMDVGAPSRAERERVLKSGGR